MTRLLWFTLPLCRACSFIVANYDLAASHSRDELAHANFFNRLRGPDGTNSRAFKGWSFLHNLLSMTGAFTLQPFASADGEVVAVFNGEIYNYKDLEAELAVGTFASDGYALLPAYARWGNDFVSRLKGEFAVVLVDFRAGTVLLGTDAFSTKPLWWAAWTASDGTARFLCASYESVLTRLGAPASARAMAEPNEALLLRIAPTASSPFAVLRRSPVVVWDLTQHKTHTRDWERAFRRAVRTRTASLKHRVFIGLSSGYDSGAVMLALHRQRQAFLAYNIPGGEPTDVVDARIKYCSDQSGAHGHGSGAAGVGAPRGRSDAAAAQPNASATPALFEAVVLPGAKRSMSSERAWLQQHCEPMSFASTSPTTGNGAWVPCEDGGAQGLSFILRHVRQQGGLIYLSGSGADEIISDYSRNGTKLYCHSCFNGRFPANLSALWPQWTSRKCAFYYGTQRMYLMKEELTGGAHGIEARYPFLDPEVVQEYLWLTHDVKNSEYKRPVADFLRRHDFPNFWGKKVGFGPTATKKGEPARLARGGCY